LILVGLTGGCNDAQTTYHVSQQAGSKYKTLSDIPSLSPGDSVLFHAGEVWRETMSFNSSGEENNYIYFGRYGDGPDPKFLGSDKVTLWTETTTPNVWQADNNFKEISYGDGDGRMFFLKNDSVIGWGDFSRNVDLSELSNEFEYTVNETTDIHYLYCIDDPNVIYDSVEISQRDKCFSFSAKNSYLIFENLDIKFAASKGIFGGYPAARGSTNLIFRHLTVQYIGYKGGPNDYGISFFHSNSLVENCFFSDCGRRAISINTYTSPEGGRRIENIIIRNNLFKRGYHTTSLDLSCMSQTGDTMQYIYFYNNKIDDSEIPYSDFLAGERTTNQVFVQGGADPFLLTNVYIVNNVFLGAWRFINFSGSMHHYIYNNTFGGMNLNNVSFSPYGSLACGNADTLDIYNNIFYDNLPDISSIQNNLIHGYKSTTVINNDYNLYWSLFPGWDRNFISVDKGTVHLFYNIDEWDDYKSDYPTHEVHSPKPADPLFKDFENKDVRILENSPALNSGKEIPWIIVKDPFGEKDTINKYDFRGYLRNPVRPSLGAFEFTYSDTIINPSDSIFSMRISPNPCDNYLNIELSGPESISNIDLILYDINGKTVMLKSFGALNEMKIMLGNQIENGVYFIKVIINSTSNITEKFLVSKTI